MNLELAIRLIESALEHGRAQGFKPLTVAVIDAGGHLVALQRSDGTANLRAEIAQGKAKGAVALGIGSRALFNRAKVEPFFIQAMNGLMDGSLVPVPGGVLIKEAGQLIGAMGITGDISDADEECAVAAIEAAGLEAVTG